MTRSAERRTASTLSIYSCGLGGTLAVAGALTYQAGARQASVALFTAAFCVLLAAVFTSLVVGRADAAEATARAEYVKHYGEDPWSDRAG